MGIRRDIRTGEEAEYRVIEILNKAGYPSSKNEDTATRAFYDIESKYDEVLFTSEVKNDVYSAKSGNVAIEVFNTRQNKASGLTCTKADLWFHVISNVVYVTTVEELKKFTNEVKPLRTIGSGGDGNAMLMLYKIEDILEIFEEISDDNHISNYRVIKNLLVGVL